MENFFVSFFALYRHRQGYGLFFLLSALLLSGCAALSPEECATADWQGLGVKDGNQGRPDRAADYLESCSKAKISFDLNAYRKGRAEGLQIYCQPDNAIREGLAGRIYGGVCPAGTMDTNFRQINTVAWREHQARQNLTRLQKEVEGWQAESRKSTISDERRRVLREQLQRSDRRMDEARDSLRSAQFQLDRLRQDLRSGNAVPF